MSAHGISPTTPTSLRRGRQRGYLWVSSATGPDRRIVLQQGTFSAGRNKAKTGKSGRRKLVAARHASLRARYWEYGETNSSLPSLIYPQWLHPQMRERFEPKREAA